MDGKLRGTVIEMKPPTPSGDNQFIGNLELSDLTIDGNASAGIGLLLNRVVTSKFN